jgi:hypothetical protein
MKGQFSPGTLLKGICRAKFEILLQSRQVLHLLQTYMGIGETEAFAFRKEFNDVQMVKFIRVGRFKSPQTKNPFYLHIPKGFGLAGIEEMNLFHSSDCFEVIQCTKEEVQGRRLQHWIIW